MSKNKILVVYNTCGIGEVPNVKGWISKLNLLVEQTIEGFHICHSDCGSDDKSLKSVRERFGGLISQYHVKDHLPIHITFNSCVQKCVDLYGEFEYYMHLSSGTNIDLNNLKRIYEWLKTDNEVGRAVIPAQNDCSSPTDFMKHAILIQKENKSIGYAHRIRLYKKNQIWTTSQKYILIPGQRFTNHASLISNSWFKKFGKKLHPDIYNGIGIEGVYSYMASSLHLQNVIIPTDLIDEYVPNDEVEGTSDRHNLQSKRSNWMFRKIRDIEKINEDNHHLGFVTDLPNRYRLEPKVVYQDRILTNYEPMVDEIRKGLFDNNGYYNNPSNEKKLLEMINKEFFLTKEEFDYDDIQYQMWKTV